MHSKNSQRHSKLNPYELSGLIQAFWKTWSIYMMNDEFNLGFYSHTNINQHTYIDLIAYCKHSQCSTNEVRSHMSSKQGSWSSMFTILISEWTISHFHQQGKRNGIEQRQRRKSVFIYAFIFLSIYLFESFCAIITTFMWIIFLLHRFCIFKMSNFLLLKFQIKTFVTFSIFTGLIFSDICV